MNYLAGTMLFDRNNRALGVTSLLNIPQATNDVLRIENAGNMTNITPSSLVSQDIQMTPNFVNDAVKFDISNAGLNVFVGSVLYNFPLDTKLSICDAGSVSCLPDTEKTSISLKTIAAGYTANSDLF
jgi:hypothetical protein